MFVVGQATNYGECYQQRRGKIKKKSPFSGDFFFTFLAAIEQRIVISVKPRSVC